MKKLTIKQERFCYEYLTNGLNATNAAIAAGYSKRTAKAAGSRLLTFVNIESKINLTRAEVAKAAGITLHRVVKELSRIAFTSVAHLYDSWLNIKPFDQISEDDKAAIQGISTVLRKRNIGTSLEPVVVDLEYIRIKMHDKCKAIDLICRIFGFYAPLKVEVPPKDPLQDADFSKLTTPELNQLLKLLEKVYGEQAKALTKEMQN